MKKISLLLVEDNEGDIVLITEVLEDRNYFDEINIVRDGEEALEFFRNSMLMNSLPSMVILDINLPKEERQ